MSIGRLVLAVIASFAVIFVFDFMFHGFYMSELYGQYKPVWRPESDMEAFMYYRVAGQFLAALAAAVLFAMGCCHGVGTGAKFGIVLGVLAASNSLIWYSIIPVPMEMLLKWIAGGLVSGLLVGVVLGLVYAPASDD